MNARTAIFIVDRNADLVYAPPQATHLLEDGSPEKPLQRELREALRRALALKANTPQIFLFRTMIVHISPLMSGFAAESRYGVLMQPNEAGDRLEEARERFALTPREIDVIRQSLRGLDAQEIADALGIAPSTVRAYFKGLLRKTEARNRSHLIAKIFAKDALDQTPEYALS